MAQPTQELQGAIQLLHSAIASEQDPKFTAQLSQCLQKMMQVQAEIMSSSGGEQSAPPPPGMAAPDPTMAPPPPGMEAPMGMPPPEMAPPPMEDPRAALMAQLGG
jgi:hypothetical protein